MACASGDVLTPICSVVMALGTTPLSDADREHSLTLTQSLTQSLTPYLAPLRALARRHSRVPDDADDLLQDALLEAVRAGRADLTQAVNYRWLTGTLRNLGAMTARSAVRRRLRESRWVLDDAPTAEHTAAPTSHEWLTHPAIAALPPALRDVARLALAGHDRREIAWLLRLTDTAMRQRIAALRRKLASSALEVSTVLAAEPPSVRELDLPLGLIRRALLPVVMAIQAVGTHDPDGHLFVFAQSGAHVRPVGGNKSEHLVVSHPDAPELSA